jgi:hypothetical protein
LKKQAHFERLAFEIVTKHAAQAREVHERALTLLSSLDINQLTMSQVQLAIAWICAREKARRGVAIREPYRVLMHWKTTDTFEQSTIEAADNDEAIHIVNGVDMRKFSERSILSSSSTSRT